VQRKKHFHGLQLHDQRVFNKKVDPKTRPCALPFVENRNLFLPLANQPARPKLYRETLFINPLEQTRTKRLMHMKCRIDHPAGKLINISGYSIPHCRHLRHSARN